MPRQADPERSDTLGMLVGVAVLGVDERRDRLHQIEEQRLDFLDQLGAVERDAGLVADGGEQFELRLIEFARHLAVDVEHAEDLIGGAHRRAHH